MKELIVSSNDSGQRFDKYLFKYFKNAPSSFIYKMLRKKNITLNSKKSDGREFIKTGDVIKLFLSDDTIDKFSGDESINRLMTDDYNSLYLKMPPIIYEDEDIILVNKPAGLLSQKADESSLSINEIVISYLLHNKVIDRNSLATFTPSICNRLDRNTSGIIVFAKTYKGANAMSVLLRERTVHKKYKCIVKGKIREDFKISGHLVKDEASNKVFIDSDNENINIYTEIKPLMISDDFTVAEVLLVTGKTHQIRAHLSSIGHPIIGDYKYGDRKVNDFYNNKYNIKSQLLCAYRIEFPADCGMLPAVSGKVFEIDIPDVFKKVINDGNVEIART